MDGTRFDRLVQRLSQAGAGRTGRRGLLAAAVALVTGASVPTQEAATKRHRRRRGDDADAEACIPTGQRCPAPKPRGRKRGGRKGNGKKGKRAKHLSCQQCCQRHVATNANGKRVCTCAETGTACTETRECCGGACTGGLCQLTASAPPAPGCTPTTCAAQGANCESLPDGCGGTLACGTCSNPTPVCITNTCTACTTSAQCPAGTICDAGSCQPCDVVCGPQEDPAVCGARLQTTLDDPNGPGTIRVCPGTYRRVFFIITRNLTLIGAGEGEDPAANTILQGEGTNSVVTLFPNLTATLQHLHITGGGGTGGGIDNFASATLTLITSTVTGNTGTSGGGIFNDNDASLTLIASTVTGNGASLSGGGIINRGGTVTIDAASRVTRNTADLEGGGIFNNDGTVTLASDQIVIDNCPDNCGGPTAVANCAATPVFCPPP